MIQNCTKCHQGTGEDVDNWKEVPSRAVCGSCHDNVDFAAARELGMPIAHTPGMFGAEVADIALSYVVALARETFLLDRGVRAGLWPKPAPPEPAN